MKKSIIKKIIISSYVLAIVLMVVSTILFNEPFLPFYFAKYILTYEYDNYKTNKEYDDIEKKNRDKNTKAAQKYIREKYGDILSEVIKLEYRNRRREYWSANSHYILKAPFCDDGELSVDSETHNAYGGFNFMMSSKFQHLYSEWVKKQIGLKDENVEFKLEYGEIDFSKIKTLNDTFDEVFENCDYTLRSINIKNIDEKDKYKIFNEYRGKYYENLNKDFENKFTVYFDEENEIWIKDYIKIGKKNYYLQDVGLNDNKTIHVLSKYEQLDNVFNNIDGIKKLLDEMIPKKIHESSSLIESDSNKIYAGSVLRLDLSDVVMRKYILDVKYYDNNIDGNNKLILVNPKYVRYTIVVDAERFSIVEHKEIHQYEYIGKQDKYKEEQIKDRGQVDGERWFYSLKLTGQIDDEKVNEVISKKLRETTEEFINNNIDAPQMVANRIYKKYLFNVFLQTGDYILIKSRILDGYLILDLQEYKFIENKIIAEDDTYMMLEFDGKIFLAYKKPNQDSFIDYTVMERVQNIIKIKFYSVKYSVKYNWRNYIVNTNNKTMEEVIAEK